MLRPLICVGLACVLTASMTGNDNGGGGGMNGGGGPPAGPGPVVTTGTISGTVTWSAQNIPGRAGFTFSHTFELPGDYWYNCTLHFGMTGVIRAP